MVDLVATALGGTASGMLSDRIRRIAESVANPANEVPPSTPELLMQIRDLLLSQISGDNAVPQRLTQNTMLEAYPTGNPYIVRYEGREHFNIYAGSAFNVLFILPFGMTTTEQLKLGWNCIDLPGGTYLYIPAGGNSTQIVAEYSSVARGTSI